MKYIKDFCYMLKYIYKLKPGVLAVYPIKIIITVIRPLVLMIFPALILDEISAGMDFSRITSLAVSMVVLTFLLNSFYNVIQNIWSHYYNILSATMGYEHLCANLNCNFENIENREYLDLQQKVRDNIMPTDYMYFVSSLIENIVQIAIYSTMVFLFDLRLLIGIIFYCAVNYAVSKKINGEEFEFSQKTAPISRIIAYYFKLSTEAAYGKDIRINGLRNLILDKMGRAHNEKISQANTHHKKIFNYNMLIFLCSFVWEAFLYYIVIESALNGTITIGSFSLYLGVLANFISQISSLLDGVGKFRYWNERIDLLHQYNNMSKKPDPGILPTSDITSIEIEFKNVWFKYPNSQDYVLKGINIKILSGEKLAVVGLNGAGKTTFIKLLCRLYTPTKGEILINGKSIEYYDAEEYANLLTVVLQDFKLLAFSVSDNIVLQNDYDPIRFEETLKKANVIDKIKQLQRGADTTVTKEFDDNGVDFSGGERQKIAIARAIYRNSKIFILDEPNSAMDPISESKFYENFREITEDKTTIYISHRLSSAIFCDRIAVFDSGSITEYGTHEELMKINGVYSDLFNKQSSGYVYGGGND